MDYSITLDLPKIEWWQKNTLWQLGLSGAGGTFVDWSINYIAGKSHNVVIDDCYQHRHQKSIISDDPCDIDFQNAHKHIKNHPANIGNMIWPCWLLHKLYPEDLHTFYLCHNGLSTRDPVYLDKSFQIIQEFFIKNPNIPYFSIYTDFDSNLFLYYRYLRAQKKIKSLDALIKFESELTAYADLEVWRQREFTALYLVGKKYRRQHLIDMQNKLSRDLSHHGMTVPLSDIFLNLDKVLLQLFKRFNHLPFNQEKFTAWRTIYKKWQQLNTEIHWFLSLPKYIDSIINGFSMHLPPINDMMQCCLEAELMMRGWMIKNEGMVVLPNNTNQIEIEDCVHTLQTS